MFLIVKKVITYYIESTSFIEILLFQGTCLKNHDVSYKTDENVSHFKAIKN